MVIYLEIKSEIKTIDDSKVKLALEEYSKLNNTEQKEFCKYLGLRW